jgi:hypothetical protein
MSFTLSVTNKPLILSVVMLSVAMLSVVMPNVVAPFFNKPARDANANQQIENIDI